MGETGARFRSLVALLLLALASGLVIARAMTKKQELDPWATLPKRSPSGDAIVQATADRPERSVIHLVLDDGLFAALGSGLPAEYKATKLSNTDFEDLLKHVSAGDSLVWIGGGSKIPADLCVGTFSPSRSPLSVTVKESSPLALNSLDIGKTRLDSGFIKPPKEMPYHNIDEEIRADFLPILEARDRFNRVVGYPGILMRYSDPSFVRHRFGGSECFFFLFKNPSEAMGVRGWDGLLNTLAEHYRSGLQLKRVQTDYASYQSGERVHVRARVMNRLSDAAATEIHFSAKAPGEQVYREIITERRVPDGKSESEAVCDFIPRGPAGLWTIRAEAWQDPVHKTELAIEGRPVPVDRRDIGVVILDGKIRTPNIIGLEGPNITINGEAAFWVGTNYYPSSSWWEWLWRDFRTLKAADDFAAMRRTGYRIVRIWVDPVLDEQSLRAMDAAIYIAAQNGIVLDVCIFNQWLRTIGFERPDGQNVAFDFRGLRDFNVYGISLRNLDLQRQYVQVLAMRWRGAGNVIYNLSNETYIKDPDPSQMDKEVAGWAGIPDESGLLRNTLLFRRWADEITAAIREAGGDQPVIPGYLFTTLGGGDAYLGDRHGQIASWHSYDRPESTASALTYVDPVCSGRPLLLEEFGTQGWNRPKYYDDTVHYALAAGAAGAMSYEWGISWLSSEMSFYPIPLRESLDTTPDPRWFKPALDLAKLWSRRGVGIHPAPSGFFYGSIYHGTPFPAAAASALGRIGLMGRDLERADKEEQVYLIIPSARDNATKDTFESLNNIIKRLWQEKVIFGVLQEECLDKVPKSTRILISTGGLTAGSERRLEELRSSGIRVFSGAGDQWLRAPELVRLSVSPSAGLNVLVRRTVGGTLYLLAGDHLIENTSLLLPDGESINLRISDYALMHERENGPAMVEATGTVTLNGTSFCTIEKGRAIIASNDHESLVRCRSARVVVTEPTDITFNRKIRSISVIEEGLPRPLATITDISRDKMSIDIDDQLARYILSVEFDS